MKGECLGNCLVYFQDGCELPEHGGLLGLFALEACLPEVLNSSMMGGQ